MAFRPAKAPLSARQFTLPTAPAASNAYGMYGTYDAYGTRYRRKLPVAGSRPSRSMACNSCSSPRS